MRLNDINISISKDKIRTGIIFLTGFAAGGAVSTLALKSKLKKRIEAHSLKQIEQIYDTSAQSVERASNAMDKLIKQTKKLEEALNSNESASGLSFYETLERKK